MERSYGTPFSILKLIKHARGVAKDELSDSTIDPSQNAREGLPKSSRGTPLSTIELAEHARGVDKVEVWGSIPQATIASYFIHI